MNDHHVVSGGFPCGLALVDAHGRLQEVNETLCEIQGRTPEHLVGQPVSSLFTVAGRTVYQSYLMPLLRLHGRVEEFALSLRGADGRTHDMLLYATSVDGRSDGTPAPYRLVLVPYRARRAVDDELLRVCRAADRAPGMIFEYRQESDGRSHFPYVSDAVRQLYGCTPLGLRESARDFLDALQPGDRERWCAEPPAAGEQRLEHFVVAVLRTGSQGSVTAWHEVHATVRRLPDGGACWQGYLADVTERRRLEDEAVERHAAEQVRIAQVEFLGRLGHELRTPLNAILAFAQLLLSGEPERLSATQTQQLSLIGAAGGQLRHLVDELTTIHRRQASAFDVELAAVDARDVLRRCLALAAPQAAAAGVELRLEAAPGERRVMADERRLGQVIHNLLSNAIKYNVRGGRVVVGLHESAGRLQLAVRDTGIGLDAEQRQRMFRPFERLGAESTDVPGTGLGLVITRQLVESMGGRIELDSTPGVGSVFRVELNLAPAAADEAPVAAGCTEPAPAPAPAPSAVPVTDLDRVGLPVLYVEDNEVNALVMTAIAERCPRVVLQVSGTAEAALAVARAQPPALLLIDHFLPDGTGGSLLRRMREDPRLRHVPAFLVTASDDGVDQARAAGFDGCWPKPLDVPRTVRAMQRALHRPSRQALDSGFVPLH